MPFHQAVWIIFGLCFFAFIGAFIFAVAAPYEMKKLKLQIFSAVLLFIAASAVAGGIYGYLSKASIGSWMQASAVIVRSVVHSYEHTATSSGGRTTRMTTMTMHRPDIVFEYSYGGRTYKGGQIAVCEVSSSDPSIAQGAVARYPVGSKIQVFVNPQSPDESMVEFDPKSPRMYLYISFAMALAFALAGLFMRYLST